VQNIREECALGRPGSPGGHRGTVAYQAEKDTEGAELAYQAEKDTDGGKAGGVTPETRGHPSLRARSAQGTD